MLSVDNIVLLVLPCGWKNKMPSTGFSDNIGATIWNISYFFKVLTNSFPVWANNLTKSCNSHYISLIVSLHQRCPLTRCKEYKFFNFCNMICFFVVILLLLGHFLLTRCRVYGRVFVFCNINFSYCYSSIAGWKNKETWGLG